MGRRRPLVHERAFDERARPRAAYFDDPVVAAQRYLESAEFDAVRSMIPRKVGRALDLGAGNGILSYALTREGWSVTAVEPDPSALVGAAAIRTLADKTGTRIDVIEAFGPGHRGFPS
ncbi:class I SAM-dependent methyltransferase [Mesorhizobium sp.]|uniref:class I SAM-dependent methyltransferase n=1 Tax=Mesorhizobium sp. TaxID=1871066 RepID=UPI000FE817A9|nr:class I SAM-dependent methyltransferase [Mesorhizobium sp.]RWP97518.1 MAG: hypothetical protein EOR89_21340 [Mesorhizobium sp.]RWQ56248.1 MAG: hypothetical protein EOS82_03715 [Mesorhizobium sp.]